MCECVCACVCGGVCVCDLRDGDLSRHVIKHRKESICMRFQSDPEKDQFANKEGRTAQDV